MKRCRLLLPVLLLTLLLTAATHDAWAGQFLSIFPENKKPDGFVFFVSTMLGLIAALSIHELGHLLTGLALGFRFELFVVFLLGIKRTDTGVKVYLNKNMEYMGGVAATSPVKHSPDNRRKFAYMVLAGPLASLLYAAICYLLLQFTDNAFYSFLLVSSMCSAGIFLATTIPNKSGSFFTDRARFQRLMSNGPAGEAEEALIEIVAQSTIDNSYKNINLAHAKLLQADKDLMTRFWGHYFEYEYYKTNDSPVLAEKAKEVLLVYKKDVSNAIWKVLKIDETS